MNEPSDQEQALARQLAELLDGSPTGNATHDASIGTKAAELSQLGQAAVLLSSHDCFELRADQFDQGLRRVNIDFERATARQAEVAARSSRLRLLWLPLPLVGALSLFFWMNWRVAPETTMVTLDRELARMQADLIAARVQGGDVSQAAFSAGMRAYRTRLMAMLEERTR